MDVPVSKFACIKSIVISLPHADAFWGICSRQLLKAFWQKENCLSHEQLNFVSQYFQLYSISILSNVENFNIFLHDYFQSHLLQIFVCGKGVKPFHMQKICSRWLWKHLNSNMETLYKWSYNYCKKIENIVSKWEIAYFEQFVHLPQCFKSLLLQRRQKASICGKGLTKTILTCHHIEARMLNVRGVVYLLFYKPQVWVLYYCWVLC